MTVDKVREESMVSIKDDLFEAVNEDWLKETEIPSDRPRISAFDNLVINNEDLLMKDFAGDFETSNSVMKEFMKFYHKTQDYAARDAYGTKPVLPQLKEVESIKDFSDFKKRAADLVLNSSAELPFAFLVSPDMKDAEHHALYFTSSGLILPDSSYYDDNHPRKTELLELYKRNTIKLLEIFGYETPFAEKTVDDVLKLDNMMVPYVNTSEEWASYADLYHPVEIETFLDKLNNIDAKHMIEQLIGKLPDKILVYEPRFYENFNKIINEENFELIKSYLLVKVVRSATPYLSDSLRVLGGEFSRALSGTTEARSQKKSAYDLATGQFSQAVGIYYGEKYFGKEAKKDVEHMTQEMIKVYQERLKDNTWLSKETIAKAIEKLDAMTVFIGYPDKLPAVYEQFIVGSTSIYDDIQTFSRARTYRHYDKFSEDVNKKEWHMPAHMVNAYFSPDSNTIVFPAAILQAPFYSLKQTSSQNYGGIGAVIAHEISHAFDNNGALFDKYGNMKNWWTKEDFKAFESKQEEMIREFDGLEIAGGKVNGTLVVSENIADAGGLTAAMTASQREEESNLEDLFKQWATVWRLKAREEFSQMLLTTDVHAPAKLRANVQPTNIDEFFQVFDIKEGDGMWRAPKNRVKIW